MSLSPILFSFLVRYTTQFYNGDEGSGVPSLKILFEAFSG